MKSANEATLEYLKTRKQFGVPIASFQVLLHRLDLRGQKVVLAGNAERGVEVDAGDGDSHGALLQNVVGVSQLYAG